MKVVPFVKHHKHFFLSLGIAIFITIVSVFIIFYAKGYRFGFATGKLEFSGTGLLVAESTPDGAEVLINGHLTTATDNTINLAPGEYDVKIFKEGYFPWEKKMTIKKEVVAKAQALLFANNPKLESVTDLDVNHPLLDPTGTRIAFTVASQSAQKNGVYILDMNTHPILNLQTSARQIADDRVDTFSKAILSWSPDDSQLSASVSAARLTPTNYLLDTGGFNQTPQDITETQDSAKATWATQKEQRDNARIAGLKRPLKQFITDNFHIISWSPDESKIAYIASKSADLPVVINPRLIGADPTPEERQIEKDTVYVYDIKEDKNYRIAKLGNYFCMPETLPCKPVFSFLPDSLHLLTENSSHQIQALEYDGTNVYTIYAGPFADGYVFPWPTGVKVIILTNLNNPTIPQNLYTITLQ